MKENDSEPNVTQGCRDAEMHVLLFQANVVALESRGMPDIGPGRVQLQL